MQCYVVLAVDQALVDPYHCNTFPQGERTGNEAAAETARKTRDGQTPHGFVQHATSGYATLATPQVTATYCGTKD